MAPRYATHVASTKKLEILHALQISSATIQLQTLLAVLNRLTRILRTGNLQQERHMWRLRSRLDRALGAVNAMELAGQRGAAGALRSITAWPKRHTLLYPTYIRHPERGLILRARMLLQVT